MRKFTISFVFALLMFYCASGQTTINAGNDTTVCLGGFSTLAATVTGGSYGTDSYSFEIIPYNPMPFTGGQSVCFSFGHCSSTASGKDDCWAGPFNIGFNFCFFNSTYDQFWIGSNGWISFTDPTGHPWTTFIARPIPDNNPDDATPKNAIFFPWEDWLPCLNSTINVYYYNSGTAPNRKLVVYWNQCPFYNSSCQDPAHLSTFQVVINEQSSIIENNIQKKPLCGNENSTQGVQNIDGTVAFTAFGRNCTQWSASNESTRFVPSGISWWVGGYPGGTVVAYGSPVFLSPSITTTYTAVVKLCDGSIATDTKTVFVENPTFSYPAPGYCQSDPNPAPTITSPGGTFTSTPAGITIDPATGLINLATSTPGSYDITYTLSNPYICTSALSITIYPVPSPPTPVASTVSICGPGNVTMSVASNPNENYYWWNSPTGGTQYPFTGATVTTNISATTDFYISTLNTTSNCQSLTRSQIHAVVNPIPDVVFTSATPSVCSGQSTSILLTSSVSGATFTWTAVASSLNVSGYTSPGAGSSITDVLLNSGLTDETVTYSVMPLANGCSPATASDYIVTVKPQPIVTLAPLTPVCISDAPFALSGGSPAGGTYSGPGVAGGIFSPAVAGTGMHTITYTYTNASGCASSGINNITVNPLPVVTLAPLTAVCIDATPFPLTGGLPVGGTYTGPGVTGGIFDPAVTGAGTFTITYTYADGNGCTNSDAKTIVVNPLPVVTFAALNPVCINAAPFLLSGGSPAGGAYSGTGISGNIFDPAAAGPGVHTITYTYTNANGCTNSTTQNITVNPLPSASGNISGTTPVCQGSSGVAYSVGAVASASTYSWSVVPAGAGILNGNTNSITVNWAAGYTGTANLFVMGVNNCGNGIVSSAFPVTVNPNPIVTYDICTDTVTILTAQPIALKGGLPVNGVYSGTGVTAGIFTPSLAGPGVHVITYSYNNMYICNASATRTIRVISPPAFICNSTLTDIRDGKQYPTVQIGSQCWMAANLNYGSNIASSSMQRDNCIPEKYCFNDNPASCILSGGLYQWDELMQFSSTVSAQGLCPPGWHVPSENDWLLLFSNFINNGFAGSALKSTGFSGFNALLNGVRFNNSSWNFSAFATMLWSSVSHGPNKAWAHGMNTFNPSVSYYPSNRSNALPARCVKD